MKYRRVITSDYYGENYRTTSLDISECGKKGRITQGGFNDFNTVVKGRNHVRKILKMWRCAQIENLKNNRSRDHFVLICEIAWESIKQYNQTKGKQK